MAGRPPTAAPQRRGFSRGEAGPFTGARLAVYPVVLFLLAFFFIPILRMLSLSLFDPGFTLVHFRHLIDVPVYRIVFWTTLKISVMVTLLCLLLGYPLAYLLAHVSEKTRTAMIVCILFPFWTSVLVRTYAWIVLLQEGGIASQLISGVGLLRRPPKLMFNLVGVNIGMVHYLLPFMVFALFSVMRGIDPRYMQAAESLGARPIAGFFQIYLPLTLPGIRSGCILVFVMALGFFITPALLGSPRESTIAMAIESQVENFLNWGFAAALSLVLLTATLIILGPTYRYVRLGVQRARG